MNKKGFGFLSISALVVALAAPLLAQSFNITANIPFEFVVANNTMPAGEYSINTVNEPNLVMLRNSTEKVGTFTFTSQESVKGTNAEASAKLVFNRYENKYFLSEIVDVHGAAGRHLPMCKSERELAHTASLSAPDKVVVLAMR